MSSFRAAYLVAPDKSPIRVLSAPVYTPGPDELLIRVHAVAVNPVDAFKQTAGKMMFPWLTYPLILGSDAAGEVLETGSAVATFAKGDHVVAVGLGMDKRGRRPEEGAFQEQMVVRACLAAKIPESLAYESAAVLPLAYGTAACGLFQKDQLALSPPRVSRERVQKGETVVVWGASTSVGNNAVQLAVAAGYDVMATAGPGNWPAVRRLGASEVFDYASPAAVTSILQALEGRTCAGVMAIGQGSLGQCIDISSALGNKPPVAQISIDTPGDLPSSALGMLPWVARFYSSQVAMWWKIWWSGVQTKFVWGTDLVDWDTEGTMFGFLGDALSKGEFVAAPEAEVVASGLEGLQKGLDAVREGVSGVKIVVSLNP